MKLKSILLFIAVFIGCKKDNSETEKEKEIDTATLFQGKHTVEIHRYDWGNPNPNGGIYNDTTFIDTIEFVKEGQGLEFKYLDENIDKFLGFRERDSVYHQDSYYYSTPSTSNRCDLYLDYVTDSIFLQNKDGGLGGGRVWNMKGKR